MQEKNCSNAARPIPPFWNFTQFVPTIPKLYWNVRSQEQRILNMFELLNKLICYTDYIAEEFSADIEELDDLAAEFEQFKESGFLDYYEEQLNAWIIEHMPDIIATYVRQVFFGLTLDGRFVAYIPVGSAWEDVIFDTGADYELDTYGRLILRYDVDQTYNVDQTPEIVRPNNTLGIYRDVRNIKNTLYAVDGD